MPRPPFQHCFLPRVWARFLQPRTQADNPTKMKNVLLALSSSLLIAGCAGVHVSDTQVASGAVNPKSIYIRPFDTTATAYVGHHRGGPGERPIRQSLAGREFADNLKEELEKLAPA